MLPSSMDTPASPLDLTLVRADYLEAVLRGDRRQACAVVIDAGLGCGATVEALSRDVVQEAQREIGRLWQENAISIAQEHMATAISQIVLARLYDHAPYVAPNGKRVLVACVEGELHDFPARFVADRLDLAGFATHFLGANVPPRSLAEQVTLLRPDMVALSVTMAFNVPALREAVAAIRVVSQALIAVGGGGCSWVSSIVSELGIELTAPDAVALVHAAKCRLGVAG